MCNRRPACKKNEKQQQWKYSGDINNKKIL